MHIPTMIEQLREWAARVDDPSIRAGMLEVADDLSAPKPLRPSCRVCRGRNVEFLGWVRADEGGHLKAVDDPYNEYSPDAGTGETWCHDCEDNQPIHWSEHV